MHFVIVKLVGCVNRHDVLASSDLVAQAIDGPACHREMILVC
jgi:hypothetical protein